MRKITCCIIDDEPLAVSLLENFISRVEFLELKGSFTDSLEAISFLKENPTNLVFLDIQMPDLDGMGLAHLLPPTTKIVFTTAFKDYALQSYEVATIDFLLKPIRFDKFLRACEKAKEWFAMQQGAHAEAPEKHEIYLRVDGVLTKIELGRIIYVEGMKDYVRFFIEGMRPLITHLTMKNVEEYLPSSRFMRISRSHIIALSRIRSVDRHLCVYIGDTVIRVTDQYRKQFEEYLNRGMA